MDVGMKNDETRKLSTSMVPLAIGQVRRWDDHISDLFLIIDIQDELVIVANGSHKKACNREDVTNFSSISELIHAGELRAWNGDAGEKTFIVVGINATKKGALLCDVLDNEKIVSISLGSVLMMSEPAI